VPQHRVLSSKNVIHSANVGINSEKVRNSHHKDDWKIDMLAVRERKRRMVTGLVDCIAIIQKQ